MKIAILLQDDNFIEESVVQAYAFTVEDSTVVSIGAELLTVKNLEYLIIWLTAKHIDIVFTDYEDAEVKKVFHKIGIKMKSLKEIKDNPLLNQFLVHNTED